MLSKLNQFFHILSNFVFCLVMIWQGFNVNISNKKPLSYIELWRYCKEWQEGKL